MTQPLLEITDLSKRFRSHWTFRAIRAVSHLSLQVFPAEAFGFLGHNGAGKTTTMKCITGLLRPTAGRIMFDGSTLTANKRSKIGFLPEQPYFYDHLTVRETMEFFASLYGMKRGYREQRIKACLELLDLADRAGSNVRTLSKGLQQRLGLAQAILNEPRLLLLDEPFSGLDPGGRREIRQVLLDERAKGTTIFMSSHILSDVEEICDRVGIMARGELKAVFALADVPRLFGEAFELRLLADNEAASALARLEALADQFTTRNSAQGAIALLRFSNYLTAHRALGEAASLGLRILGFENVSLSLEQIFMNITEKHEGAQDGAGSALPAEAAGAEGER